MTVHYDADNVLYQPKIDDTLIPVPSSMDESLETYGAEFQLPNGDTITQDRFTGRVFSWTWDGMNYDDQETMRGLISGFGHDKVQLTIPTPKTEVSADTACVRANGSSPYSSTVRYNVEAQALRYVVTMSWKEVPGTCVVV